MIGLVLRTLLMTIVSTQAYETKCPSASHWHLRATAICSNELNDFYTCLLEIENKGISVYKDYCGLEEFGREGFKYVLQPNPQQVTCSESFYQPLMFSSIGNSRCVFTKSLCNEEGQLTADDGTSKSDRSCRCDYTKGYAYVFPSKKLKCTCVPSKEDCSCYQKSCLDNNKKMYKDYKCYDKQAHILPEKILCDEVKLTSTSILDNTDTPVIFQNVSKGYVITRVPTFVLKVVIIFTLVYLVLLLILFIEVTPTIQISVSSDLNEYVFDDQNRYTFTEGEKFQIHCQIYSTFKIKYISWLKDGIEHLKEFGDIGARSEVILQLTSIHDAGTYTCVVKNILGLTNRSVVACLGLRSKRIISILEEFPAMNMERQSSFTIHVLVTPRQMNKKMEKHLKIEEAYLKLRQELRNLTVNEGLLKHIDSAFKELKMFNPLDRLINDIVEFTEIAVRLHPNDVCDSMKLIVMANSIVSNAKKHEQIASHLYNAVIAGLTLYNHRHMNEVSIELLFKNDRIEEIKEIECDSIDHVKFEISQEAHLLCGLTDEHVHVSISTINMESGEEKLGKLADQIIKLRDKQRDNYCNGLDTNFVKLMNLVKVYCYLVNMKYGIWLHYYSLLQLYGNSKDVASATKNIIDEQELNDIQLLEFVVHPTKQTAIIHYLGNMQQQIIPKTFLQLRGMKDYDLSFLEEGEYRLSPVMYTNSRLYMTEYFQLVGWTSKPQRKQSKFSFKRINCPGNYFHILSEHFKGYHLIRSINGWYTRGRSGLPSVDRPYSIWKIVPVTIDNQTPSNDITYAMLATKDTERIFLFAGFTGRVCVQKFTEIEVDQILWKIAKI